MNNNPSNDGCIDSTNGFRSSRCLSDASESSLLSLVDLDDLNALSEAQLLESNHDRAHSQESDGYYNNAFIAFLYLCFDCCAPQRDYYGSNQSHWGEDDNNYGVGKRHNEICTPQNNTISQPPAYGLECSLNKGVA